MKTKIFLFSLLCTYSLMAQESFSFETSVEVTSEKKIDVPFVLPKKEELGIEIKGSPYGNDGIEDEDEYLNPFSKTKKKALEGDSKAQMEMAILYLKDIDGIERNPKEAYKWYKMAALQGEAMALYALGEMHEQGKGVSIDLSKAFQWYLKSANQGVEAAILKTGKMYEKGLGIVLDYEQARKWYLELADKGNSDGFYHLGKLFFNGTGVRRDLIKSYALFAKAAGLGSSKSVVMRDLSIQGLSSLQIERAQKLSRKAFSKRDF
jgi:TPR repeat protein